MIVEIINFFVDFATSFISSGGFLFGFLLILLESIIPALPLGVFVTLNVNAFGMVFGVLISWLATCVGCFLSYLLFCYLSNNFIYKFMSKKMKNRVSRGMKKFKKIPFSNLVVIIALPFTPAFLINILAGMAGISKKKFVLSLMIGKVFMLLFWAYVGKSLIESVTDISTIFIISLMLVIAYLLSKIVSKKTNIE